MFKKTCYLALALGALTITSSAYSLVSKDYWTKAVKKQLSYHFCHRGPDTLKKAMAKKHITPEQCIVQMGKVFDKCVTKYHHEMPERLDRKAGGVWGKKLGHCAGVKYYNNYLSSPKTKEQVKAHLLKTTPDRLCKTITHRITSITSTQCHQTVKSSLSSCVNSVMKDAPDELSAKRLELIRGNLVACLVAKM